MSFELDIGLQRVVLPAVCSLIGCTLLVRTDQGEDWFDDEPVKGIAFPTVLGVILCAAGLIGSDLWQRGLITTPGEWSTWKASHQWEWMSWMIPASMVVLGLARAIFSIPTHFTGLAGTVTGAIAIGVLFVCLNEGVEPDDQPKLLPWMGASCLAAMCNMAALNSIARAGGSRWVSLTMLGQLGCVAAITLQSYGRLGEWAIAGIAVALGASVVGAFGNSSSAKLHYGWQLSIIVLPLAVMAVACLAVSRFFFESQPLPIWLIGSVLFLPTIVGLFDFIVGRLTSEWFRVVLAALLCSLVLATILYITKPWQSEW